MDLRNNTITLGELLADPRAKAVFQRRFDQLMRHPMLAFARSMTLGQLARRAESHLPREVILETIQELRDL